LAVEPESNKETTLFENALDTPNVSPDYSLKEERAWYCFDWASAVYGTTILGAFIPTLFSTLYPASYYTSCIAGSVLLQVRALFWPFYYSNNHISDDSFYLDWWDGRLGQLSQKVDDAFFHDVCNWMLFLPSCQHKSH
jgi:hypothetical protein